MRKKSVFALLVALMMVLSGCALVTTDTEKDNARVIIDVNGETVTKSVIKAAIQNQISQNQYYNQMFASSGYSMNLPVDEAGVTADVLEAYTENLVLKQKAFAAGLNNLTEEEQAQAEETAKTNYRAFLDSVISAYLPNSALEGDELDAAAEKYVAENSVTTADKRSTLADFIDNAVTAKAIEKLEADIVKDVQVTEEEIVAEFNSRVEQDKESMTADPNAYGYNLINGATAYYAPAGYRMIKHILLAISDEDQAVITEKQTALTEAKDALTAAAEDADKEALQAAVDAAQAAYDEAKAAGLANAKAKAEEVRTLVLAEGADFDALIAEYSDDNTPAGGYAIREGFPYFVASFVEGAMALEKPGDVSEPVESTYGYHIIQYVSDVAEGPVDMEPVRDSIASSLKTTKENNLTHETIHQWVDEANVKTYADRLK